MPTPIESCRQHLPGVSRTFALLIPELPPPLRDEVACAYLLCRIADTIEDVPGVALDVRTRAFDALDTAILITDARPDALDTLAALAADWPLDADHRRLLDDAAVVLAALDAFPWADRRIIADCVHEMICGMKGAVAVAATTGPNALRDVADLERYCYYVAGVVGRMLTRLYWQHVHSDGSTAPETLVAQGIEFGLGLQLTNVLKDHRADLGRGVSYMPAALIAALELDPDAALDGPLPRPVREQLVTHALGWLDTAFAYALAWPAAAIGIRVFCLGALLMAVRTLGVVLRSEGRLDATEAPKITRTDVAEIMTRARADAADDDALRRWYDDERSRLAALLPQPLVRNNGLTE